MVDEALLIIGRSFSFCVEFFTRSLSEADLVGTYLAAIFLVLVSKFILRPIFGAIVWSAGSDTARSMRENSRYKGRFERGQHGKYSR